MNNMKKIKIAHIHTDPKFIGNIKYYNNPSFDNLIIIIGDKKAYDAKYQNTAIFYNLDRYGLNDIIKKCNKFDVVVLNCLDFYKAYICNRLEEHVLVIWRFFGAELYSKLSDYVYSKETKKIIEKNIIRKILAPLRNKISLLVNYAKFQTIPVLEIERSFDRINHFLCLAHEEYIFLKKNWKNLPKFMQHPFLFENKEVNLFNCKKNKIIVGHSRNSFNNHVDILIKLQYLDKSKNYQFVLIFNYGQQDNYSNHVLKIARKIGVEIISEFMAYEEYAKFYESVVVFIQNAHRQIAVGNIIIAFQNGTKVYLNKQNILYEWFLNEGFKVFDVECFYEDYRNNDLHLSHKDRIHNEIALKNISDKYNVIIFHDNIMKFVSQCRDSKCFNANYLSIGV
ncbi:MAG: hypothetical protein EOL98_09950 [Negativicutes bacterium]|nr:hypothetical protein [Negativicutes bacterium]